MHKKVTVREYIIILVLSISLAIGLNNVLLLLHLEQYSKAYQEAVKALYSPGLLEQIFVTCISVPIIEELLFRGVVFKVLRRWIPFAFAMLISSVLFGLYHGNLVQFIYATICGLMLAYFYERYRSIIAPIIAHIAMNLVAVLFTEYGVFLWMLGHLYRAIAIAALCFAMFGFSLYCLNKDKAK